VLKVALEAIGCGIVPARSSAPTRRLVRRADRRDEIVDVAIALIRQRGPDVTVADIAAAAEISEGTVFYVFEDRAALFNACIERLVDGEAMARAARLDTAASLEARVTAVASVVRENMAEVVPLILAIMRSPSRHGGPPPLSVFTRVEALMVDALDVGATWSEPLDVLASDLLGRLFGQVFRSVTGGPAVPPLERTVDTFLHGALRDTSR
jgi:AcrR family transcriptional regulator